MTPDKYIKNYINGSLIAPSTGIYLDDTNPSTGKVYAYLPDSNASDVQRAVEAAERAFPIWSSCGLRKRFRILMRIADIIEQNLEEFARAESEDTGKPLAMARRIDIPRAHSNFRFFATSILHYQSDSQFMEGEAINFTLRQAIGVVGCIIPWNLPMYLLSWKVAAALAVGNCVVLKPSEFAPMTAYMLAKACSEAGLPAGVLNIVNGQGSKVGKVIVEHPKIKAISFTGKTETGRDIASIAAPLFKKTNLEMGSKNASIIFADCDFDQMMLGTLQSCFSNSGQICWCTPRVYVERPIYDRFKEEMVRRVQYLKVGDPFSAVTDLGPIISQERLKRIQGYISLAQMEGGKLLCGEESFGLKSENEAGFFVRPTIIEGLGIESRINQEEIFGPVITITPFDTEEEAILYANDTDYGLAASIWTKNVTRANRIAERLNTGLIWINCWMLWDMRSTYGGSKQSGMGREGGTEALSFFTEPKNVCIKY